jgi:D-alanine transfer protein
MPLVRLRAALLAVTLLALAALGGELRAERLERACLDAIAPQLFDEKTLGASLQRAALARDDLLPVYGSSDFAMQPEYGRSFAPTEFFRRYPTGFAVFVIARTKATCLSGLLRMAALGERLAGRRVVFVISPTEFIAPRQTQGGYRNNFSPLLASELVWSDELSLDLRRRAAVRMLGFPRTLVDEPLLAFGLRHLAGDGFMDRARYWASYPLGRLLMLTLRLQDHWAAFSYLQNRPRLGRPTPRRGEAWAQALEEAERDKGRPGPQMPQQFVPRLRPRTSGPEASPEWTDYELLLQGLDELKARPLLLVPPLDGHFFEARGLSAAERAEVYSALAAGARRHGFSAVVFSDHDLDPEFSIDTWAHPAQEGWTLIDQALDDFAHDRLDKTAVAR